MKNEIWSEAICVKRALFSGSQLAPIYNTWEVLSIVTIVIVINCERLQVYTLSWELIGICYTMVYLLPVNDQYRHWCRLLSVWNISEISLETHIDTAASNTRKDI